MVDLAEIQAIYYIVAATGVLIAAIFYMLNLRISRKNQELMLKAQEQSARAQQQTLETRQAQFMMQLNESMMNTEVTKDHIELMNMEWTDLDDFERKWGSGGNVEAAAKRLSMWWRLNFIGDLFQRNLVDREWLYETFSSVVVMEWFKWEPIITLVRKLFNDPHYGTHFEYLAKEMIKMDEQKGFKRSNPKTLTYEDAHLGKVE